MSWRARLSNADDYPGARQDHSPVSNGALLKQLKHRFTASHARAIESKHAALLERGRKQRRLRPDARERLEELVSQADAVLGTSAQDRAARARRYLEAAMELDRLDPRAHLRLGFVLSQEGRYGPAAESFQRAGESLPDGLAPMLRGSAALLASRAWARAEQFKEAWEQANTAEQILPNDGGVHYQKALVASRYTQAERSVKIQLRRAIDLDPLYFTLAALEPDFEDTTWATAVKPLLQEIEDQSIQALVEQRDSCTSLYRELEDIAASPRFSQLSPAIGGGMEAGHDPHAETRSLLGWARGLISAVEASFRQGPASRSAYDGKLHQAQQRLKQWIVIWQKAMMDSIQDLATKALPGADDKALPKGAARHIQRLTELLAEAEQLESGAGKSAEVLRLERAIAREVHAIDVLRAPKPKAKPKRRGRILMALGSMGHYLAVMVAVLAALGADLLVLHSSSFADHPFLATAGCAALTVYLPELVARLTRPRSEGDGGWRMHELAFLPAYMLFPVLPAAGVVLAFPTAGMFMLMMAVCALMSLLLIVGLTGRR